MLTQNYLEGQEIAKIHCLEKAEVKKTPIRNTLLSFAFKPHMPQFSKLQHALSLKRSKAFDRRKVDRDDCDLELLLIL